METGGHRGRHRPRRSPGQLPHRTPPGRRRPTAQHPRPDGTDERLLGGGPGPARTPEPTHLHRTRVLPKPGRTPLRTGRHLPGPRAPPPPDRSPRTQPRTLRQHRPLHAAPDRPPRPAEFHRHPGTALHPPHIITHAAHRPDPRPAWSTVRAALIRPDGHVAWASEQPDAEVLRAEAHVAVSATHR
ncbi:aromatic-ring hydroxylase C-terminal domain-containing protein [Streptomyces sp. NBC_01023]|uniref:aromatic-ring hydroxylase C-terminal domain-containing protein n=1 Tax=unclassified Streptomyces TaxID=2593676 RepID=UPI00386F0727